MSFFGPDELLTVDPDRWPLASLTVCGSNSMRSIMRNRIFGAIGVVWGGFILLNTLFHRMNSAHNTTYRTGQ